MTYYVQSLQTPVGEIFIVAHETALIATSFKDNWKKTKRAFDALEEKETPLLKRAKKQLHEYFSGNRKEFDLPYELMGTEFQKNVWKTLTTIPYGVTRTYKYQAEIIKSPKAVRAVGRANGLNPLCVILPCHRVIGSNGTLTGYAGGLPIKQFLLGLECEKKECHGKKNSW